MGEFDATKQANVILLLRGERFAGCDLPEDSSRSTPQAATMTTSSQNWSSVGTQATGLADDLDSALKQLLKGWEGKAADEFSTNVTKVVAFARQIAHVADTDNPAPAADGTANPFATSKSSTGYKQLFTHLASDVTTHTGTSKAPGLPWETGRWWWKWYDTWSFNYEVRDDSGVVNGDINGDKFVDFMRDHGIPTNDAADGLVSHPLPKDWPASVKAFEAKEFNTDQQNDCRAAGNDLATKYKDFGDGLGDAPVAPTLTGSSGLPDTSGVGSTPGGGMPTRGGGSAGGVSGGGSGGAPNFTPPDLTDTGGSGGSSGSGGSGGVPDGSGGGLPGGSGGTRSGGVGTESSWPGGSGSAGSGSSGSGGSGPVTGSGSWTYGGGSGGSGSYGDGSGGSGGGSYDSGSSNYPGSGAGGWNDGSTGTDTGGVLAGYDPGTDGSGASGSGGYGSGGYGSGTPTGAGAGGFGSTGGLGTSAGSGLSGSAAGGSSAGGSGSGASGSGGLAPGSVGGAGSAGSASSGGGSGMMAPMMGGGGGGRGGQESQHQTWIVEDEDVWGAREGETAPPVIGGSL